MTMAAAVNALPFAVLLAALLSFFGCDVDAGSIQQGLSGAGPDTSTPPVELGASPYEEQYGALTECSWNGGGGMEAEVNGATLARGEDGALRLTVREGSMLYGPIEVRVYRADDDALRQMLAIIDAYSLPELQDAPYLYELLDAPSNSIGMTFVTEDEDYTWFSVDGHAELGDEGSEGFRAFIDCLYQWQTDDRLVESYEESDSLGW